MELKKRKLSPLQQVCMQYGKDMRAVSNSHMLSQFLRLHGKKAEARAVETALETARVIARENYFKHRKSLQPDWKDWKEQWLEAAYEGEYKSIWKQLLQHYSSYYIAKFDLIEGLALDDIGRVEKYIEEFGISTKKSKDKIILGEAFLWSSTPEGYRYWTARNCDLE